ncbi:serine/threonine-protein kinase Nek3 [Elysia marginata]|uniref:Serine/threonine-protein kinase Nek3 n=1 Tax=Elysia marginata TaxID=1093978 RepID=A0AAV4IFZ8_9GAST|nr:serine/threonine-protein kinase Nek3 [Elysia marginata]
MAEAAASSGVQEPHVVDLGEEDFFERYGLTKLKILGQGLAGRIYLVKADNDGGVSMAVKKFPLFEELRDQSLQHFKAEVSTMQALSHPNLVPCHIAVRCEDYLALAMPYYPGGDLLDDWGNQGVPLITSYMLDVARAVEYMHSKRIAHTDIKPDNVFVSASGHAHLGDFGLAVAMTGESGTIAARWLGGTEEYWAPEQVDADPQDGLDPFKLDVYALGVTFYVLVSEEEPDMDVDYLARVQASPDLGLSPNQRSALEQMLQPNPLDRPTASQVVKLLEMK